jgi:VanZ family protein
MSKDTSAASAVGNGPETGVWALRYRRWWQAIGWMMVSIVVWLSLTPSPPAPPALLTWDKAHHFIAYGGLMYWFAQAFARHWRWPVFLCVLGLALEFLQGWGGVRTFDLFDLTANVLGVVMGLAVARTGLGRLLALADRRLALFST